LFADESKENQDFYSETTIINKELEIDVMYLFVEKQQTLDE